MLLWNCWSYMDQKCGLPFADMKGLNCLGLRPLLEVVSKFICEPQFCWVVLVYSCSVVGPVYYLRPTLGPHVYYGEKLT